MQQKSPREREMLVYIIPPPGYDVALTLETPLSYVVLFNVCYMP